MRNKLVWLIVLGVICGGVSGCDKLNFINSGKKSVKVEMAPAAIQVKGAVIAKVDNNSVGLDDFNEEIQAYNANVPDNQPELRITTKDQKVNFLRNDIVRRLLIYQDALDKGLERDAEVKNDIEKTKLNLLVMKNIQEITKNVDVSSKEVEDYYNAYKEQLRDPEERQISEIVVATESEAKEILIQLLQGADFATLAKNNSKSASAQKGGDLGFIAKGNSKKSPQFEAAAFSDSLNVGETSSIFKTPEGYSIIKLTGKHGGNLKSLSEMWDELKRGLTFLKQQKALEDYIGKLSSKAKIEIREGEIK